MRSVLRVVSLVLVFLIVLPAIATARPTKAPPKRSSGPVVYHVKKVDERWAMRDGARLPVSVYSPVPNKQGELFPAIVFVHPWDIDKSLYDALAAQYGSRGYVGVTYTVRGWFGADGDINCIDPDYEVKDLSNIITLASQDTRFPIVKDSIGPVVGVMGYSMGGVHSFLIAPRRNPRPGDPGDPRVRAVVPMHGGADLLCSIYPNGAVKWFWATMLLVGGYIGNFGGSMFNMLSIIMNPDLDVLQKVSSLIGLLGSWQSLFNRVTPDLARIYAIATQRQEAYEDEAKMYMKKRSARWWCDEEFDGKVEHPITAPMLIVAGWKDDLFVPNEGLGVFNSMIAAPKKIIIENHGHAGGFELPISQLPKDPEKVWISQEVEKWFDHFLKGANNGVESEPAISYYRDWDPKNFGTSAQWPPAGTQDVSYYLGGGTGFRQGSLAKEAATASPPDLLVNTGFCGSISMPYFSDATELVGWQNLNLPENMDVINMPFQRYSYLSEPMPNDRVIDGTPRLSLSYQSSSQFTQLNPRLYEVSPDGKRTFITRGWYEGHDKRCWTRISTADNPVEMVACCHKVKAGDRLELELRTSDMIQTWPLWGLSFINILHDSPAPSSIILPMSAQ